MPTFRSLHAACSAAISMRPATVRMGIRHRGTGMIVAGLLSRKGGETVLSVAARQSSICCDCRVGRRPASASLAFKGGATAVAFDVHLEDGGVMNEAVDDSDRHCLVREDFAPFAEGLVGGDEEGSPLVAGADELKEHAGFGLVFGDHAMSSRISRWNLSSLVM